MLCLCLPCRIFRSINANCQSRISWTGVVRLNLISVMETIKLSIENSVKVDHLFSIVNKYSKRLTVTKITMFMSTIKWSTQWSTLYDLFCRNTLQFGQHLMGTELRRKRAFLPEQFNGLGGI